MKIKTLSALMIIEPGDVVAIRVSDGQALYGSIVVVDELTDSIIVEADNNETAVIKVKEIESIQAPEFSYDLFRRPKILPALVPVAIGVVGLLAEPLTAIVEEAVTNGLATAGDDTYSPPVPPPLPTPPGGVGKRTYHRFGCPCGRCNGGGIWVDND